MASLPCNARECSPSGGMFWAGCWGILIYTMGIRVGAGSSETRGEGFRGSVGNPCVSFLWQREFVWGPASSIPNRGLVWGARGAGSAVPVTQPPLPPRHPADGHAGADAARGVDAQGEVQGLEEAALLQAAGRLHDHLVPVQEDGQNRVRL